jgi:hypothetical protein
MIWSRSAATLIMGLVGIADAASADGLKFKAALSGAQEVTGDTPGTTPGGVETVTSGRIELEFDEALASARVKLEVNNGVGVIAAHLYCGRAGTNGTVVVPLLRASGGVDADGVLVGGILTNDSIGGPQTRIRADCRQYIGVPVDNMASLAFAARAGLIYANVLTLANPEGEVRGQLLEE